MYSTKYHPMNERETIAKLAEKLPVLLPNLNIEDISLEVSIGQGSRADVIVKVRIGDLEKYLLIEVRSSGEPRIVQSSIYQLRKLVGNDKENYPVFAAPYVGEKSREILVSENIGYIDLIGDVYLKFNSVLVDRISNTERETERRLSRGIFAPNATPIADTAPSLQSKRWLPCKVLVCELTQRGHSLRWRLIDLQNQMKYVSSRGSYPLDVFLK